MRDGTKEVTQCNFDFCKLPIKNAAHLLHVLVRFEHLCEIIIRPPPCKLNLLKFVDGLCNCIQGLIITLNEGGSGGQVRRNLKEMKKYCIQESLSFQIIPHTPKLQRLIGHDV